MPGVPGGDKQPPRRSAQRGAGLYGREVLRVMMSKRWLGMLAIAVVFAVACFFLGRWQWHRHEAKATRAERIESHYSASPIPLASALPSPSTSLRPEQEWTMVTATGRYAAREVMLVRNR